MAEMAPKTPCCPICEQPIQLEPTPPNTLPFCSKRCKLVDLSRWLSEDYRVASTPSDTFGLLDLDDLEDFQGE